MTPVYALVYVCLMATIVAVALTAAAVWKRTGSAQRPPRRDPRLGTTSFLDSENGPEKCRICLGALADGPVAVCECGAVVHTGCAAAADCCPFCGRPAAAMRTAELRLPACPVCGAGLHRGQCPACGAIVTGAGRSFECPLCHRPVSVRRPVCRCGARFEPVRPKGFMGRLR